MKFLELSDLDKLNSILKFETPELRIKGGIELFSTKPQSYDKKLYKTLDKHINSLQNDAIFQYTANSTSGTAKSFSPPNASFAEFNSQGKSATSTTSTSFQDKDATSLSIPPGLASSLNSSPFGPLDQAASRKAFGYLISVLNSSHPDHDFSSLQPSDFRRETSIPGVLNSFNNIIFSVGMPLSPNLWLLVDEHISLKECAVYSHVPSDNFLNDLESGTLWCYMWFFFNKRRKRVAYLYLTAIRTHEVSSSAKQKELRERKNSSNSGFYSDYYEEEEYDLANTSGDEEGVVGDLELE